MRTKRIKCPKCGTVMDVTNTRNEDVKHIKCPGCATALAISFADGETLYYKKKPRKAGKPVLEYNGNEYPLAVGDNIVGRKASSSSATLQIDTSADEEGMTMSREHIRIRVVRLSGGEYRSVVSVYNAKNHTSVNGEQLSGEDGIVLYPGDCIRMGNVAVVFKESAVNNDGDMTKTI